MYVNERYKLSDSFKRKLRGLAPNFGYGIFGRIVYYRTYSRTMQDGGQEHWADTVIRVIEGIMSIRKDHYKKNNIHWDTDKWDTFAQNMAWSMFNMHWLPPGRGIWAMGSDMMYERGSMCLYNCAYSLLSKNWVDDLAWVMDSLMWGVGVGFQACTVDIPKVSTISKHRIYVIPDTREGWVESVRQLLEGLSVGTLTLFNYDSIRPHGAPIKGFGGTASGPGPLRILHTQLIRGYQDYCIHGDSVRFLTDCANQIGCCVVAGNVRRSAEIALGHMDHTSFIDLKDYNKYPERADWGWMSNNSVILKDDVDFDALSEIAIRVIKQGEPGYVNYRNFPHGRLGHNDNVSHDHAIGINPCGEIPLEHREVCNVADTLPTRCTDYLAWLTACQYATFYTSTVALLPTHQPTTNAVVTRNRRIGVGIIDYIGWKDQLGLNKVIKYMRMGYKEIRRINTSLAQEAGVRDSIRVTTVKPGGTTTKLAGRQAGIGHPNFRYMLRRIRIQKNTPIEKLLIDAGVPHEPCLNQPAFTTVFEVPVYMGDSRTMDEVSLWEQAMNLVTVQREWADNAVSNTLTFKENEKDIIENVLSAIAPLTKSVSLLPHSDKGAYPQMPEEGITRQEYYDRINAIREIDWSNFKNSDGADEKFCDGDQCVIT